MADDGSAQSQNIWPLPKFYFQVDGLGGSVGTYFWPWLKVWYKG